MDMDKCQSEFERDCLVFGEISVINNDDEMWFSSYNQLVMLKIYSLDHTYIIRGRSCAISYYNDHVSIGL